MFVAAILLMISGAGFSAQNQILVERLKTPLALPLTSEKLTPEKLTPEKLTPEKLTPEFLQTLTQSSVGFTEASAAKMQVTRDQPALWRIRLGARVNGSLLVINNSFDRDVMLYFPPKFAPEKHNLYDASKPTEHSRFALAIRFPDSLKGGDVFFITIPRPTAAPLHMQILDRVSYARRDLNLVRLHSAIISMLIASCAVALCFFLILRERVWLYFIAYLLAQIGYVLTRTGELIAIIDSVVLDRVIWQAATIFSVISAALLAFFLIEFVKLKETMPKVAIALKYYGWILIFYGFAAFVPGIASSNALSVFANSTLLIGIALTVYANLASVRNGSRPAVFFLVAYLPHLIAAVVMIVQMRGGLSGGVWITVFFLSSYAFSSIMLSLGLADQVLGYRNQRDAAIDESQHDPLTGALNRRAANQALARAIKRLDTTHGSLAVCFFDLDFFKRVNDQFGHALGDEALRLLSSQAQLELRSSDFLARLGGEEFIGVLPGAYLRDGLAIAERIRARVEKHGRSIAGQPVNLTVSVGVIASNAKLNSADALIDAADQALYLAKSRGRNRVETIDLVSLASQKKEKAA